MDSFWFLNVIFLMVFISKTSAALSCPNIVAVEKGTNYTITCEVGSNVSDFYWYKGKASQQDLVGRLENGIKNIPVWYKDNYDVKASGALVILNAGIMHETLYDLVTFDYRGSIEEDQVIVNITILPDPACPLINDCTTCTRCNLSSKTEVGKFTCKVENARPHVPLRWNTVYQTGMSFVKYPPQITQRNISADSWDSSVSLDIEIMELCGAEIVLQCVAEDPLHILQSTVSTIKVTQDQCHFLTPATLPLDVILQPKTFPVSAVLVSVTLAVVLMVVVAVFYAIYRRRHSREAGKTGHKFSREEEEPLSSLSPDNELVEKLIDKVKKCYRKDKLCYLKPLPWADEISIAELYTESLCYVTDEGSDDASKISSNELRTTKNISKQEFVIFTGEHGDGRTTFLKYIVNEWIKSEEKVHLLIYIPLKKVNTDMPLSKFVKKEILKTKNFKSKDIDSILRSKNNHCLVILDGLEDKTDSFKKGVKINKEKKKYRNEESPVTIGKLLGVRMNQEYQNLHLWVSCREADCDSVLQIKDYLKVQMVGFSEEQFDCYVKKCCLYYVNNFKRNDKNALQKMLSNNSSNKNIPDQDNVDAGVNIIFKRLQDYFKRYDNLKEFRESRLLVKLMVHVMAAIYAGVDPHLEEKDITTMVKLMFVVVKCMKARYKSKNSSFTANDFSNLEASLGDIALKEDIAPKGNARKQDMAQEIWVEILGEKYVNAALEIGFLKLTARSSSNPKFSSLEFHHEYIQDYLAASYILKTSWSYPEKEEEVKRYEKNRVERIKEFMTELQNFKRYEMN